MQVQRFLAEAPVPTSAPEAAVGAAASAPEQRTQEPPSGRTAQLDARPGFDVQQSTRAAMRVDALRPAASVAQQPGIQPPPPQPVHAASDGAVGPAAADIAEAGRISAAPAAATAAATKKRKQPEAAAEEPGVQQESLAHGLVTVVLPTRSLKQLQLPRRLLRC